MDAQFSVKQLKDGYRYDNERQVAVVEVSGDSLAEFRGAPHYAREQFNNFLKGEVAAGRCSA